MMTEWIEVEKNASAVFDFLKKDIYFDRSFDGEKVSGKVIFDAIKTIRYSGNDPGNGMEDWQSLLDQVSSGAYSLPQKMQSSILDAIGEGLLPDKDYSGVPEPLLNNMEGDMYRLLCCYATGRVSDFWKRIENAYLENALPCGWEGKYPEGRLMVFSNRN